MENHKQLYKDYSSYNPRQNSRINRELLNANRTQQRRDRFHGSRNISPSPIRHKKEVMIPLHPNDKKNSQNLNEQSNPNTTRLVKIVCSATNPEKLTKQEAYIKRFVEWKENKKNMKKEINKKKPFISAVNNGRQAATSSSLVPRGHNGEFRPPVGLKNILDEKVKSSKTPLNKGRQSIYTVVPTPPRKHIQEKYANKLANVKKNLPTTLSAKKFSNDGPNLTRSSIKVNSGNAQRENQITSFKSAAKAAPANLVNKFEKSKITTLSAKPLVKRELRSKILTMPPPPSTKVVATGTSKQKGAVGKIKEMAQKRVEVVKKQNNKSPIKHNRVRLAQNLKAKKNLQITTKNVMSLLNDKQLIQDMVIQTPRDFSTLNHFDEFVTSTKIKTASNISENEAEVRVIDTANKKSQRTSSAKRNIMQGTRNTNLLNKSVKTADKSTKANDSKSRLKKHNFIRYSEATDSKDEEKKVEDKEDESVSPHRDDGKTSTKCGPEERPANYLSPFVSVARGKVSLKKETEKRNTIYLQNTDESNDLHTDGTNQDISLKYSLEVRRTLEAVRYFRNQLQGEIDRLYKLCDVWETYKEENLEKIQNANGEDMINVTIGQTRLLTSKKFMQFKGLIDRCEAGATGIGAVECDGSENTKPITSADLEGFWSMLGLQVDNLEKRFENLNRWKSNDWKDPDNEKTEIKTNLTKVKKYKPAAVTKAKPNSALQQMLRKMQAEMRKNKKQPEDASDAVLIPSKLREELSENNYDACKFLEKDGPRRLSIVVKDRKYFSPSPTVISVLSTNQRTNNMRQTSLDTPKQIKHIRNFNESLDFMQSSFGLRKSALFNESTRRNSLKPQSPRMGIKSDKQKGVLPPTVASVLSTNQRTNNMDQSTQNTPKQIKHIRNFNEALDIMQSSFGLRKSILFNESTRRNSLKPQSPMAGIKTDDHSEVLVANTENKENTNTDPESPPRSPVITGRKSILKTPGSAVSRLRNVIFNEKLRVKRINFLIHEGGDPINGEDANDTHEEDLAKSCEEQPRRRDSPQRTLTLRNRKVRLRPSSEIIIPK